MSVPSPSLSDAPSVDDGFEAVWASVAGIRGWLTTAQGRRLWDGAKALKPGQQLVEIGSYHGRSLIVLAAASDAGVGVVAVDPHAGNDSRPNVYAGSPEEGQTDHQQFVANLAKAGVADRVTYLRLPSEEAHRRVDGPVDLLYIDGAHRYGICRDDIWHYGSRVPPGGTMLIHDCFSGAQVTLALARTLFLGPSFRFVGRTGSLGEYRREPVPGLDRVRNGARQAASLPWLLRNMVIKVAVLAGVPQVARWLGHHEADPWPH